MMYAEFLEGTKTQDNKYTYSEYLRIEAIYTECVSLSKEDAYKLYQEPDSLIQELLDDLDELKSFAISYRSLYEAEHQKHTELLKEYEALKELRTQDFETIRNYAKLITNITND